MSAYVQITSWIFLDCATIVFFCCSKRTGNVEKIPLEITEVPTSPATGCVLESLRKYTDTPKGFLEDQVLKV